MNTASSFSTAQFLDSFDASRSSSTQTHERCPLKTWPQKVADFIPRFVKPLGRSKLSETQSRVVAMLDAARTLFDWVGSARTDLRLQRRSDN